MNDSWYALSFVGVIITVLVMVGALIMVVLRAKGRAKKLGTIGLILMLVAVVARTASLPALATLMTGDLYAPVSQSVSLLLGLLQTAGVAVLAAAVIVGSKGADESPRVPQYPGGVQYPAGPQQPRGPQYPAGPQDPAGPQYPAGPQDPAGRQDPTDPQYPTDPR